MTALHLTAGDALRPRLAQLTADVLRIPVGDVQPAVPLAAMGLDSLAAAELTALIEDELNHELPSAVLSNVLLLNRFRASSNRALLDHPLKAMDGPERQALRECWQTRFCRRTSCRQALKTGLRMMCF